MDPDDRPVAHRVVVGRDRRMALRVVADVDEQLGGALGHVDAVEEEARGRALLRHDRVGVVEAPVGVPDGVGSALGDPGQQRLRGERPIDVAAGREAVAGDSAHGLDPVRCSGRWFRPLHHRTLRLLLKLELRPRAPSWPPLRGRHSFEG